jgi:hypothetical protein
MTTRTSTRLQDGKFIMTVNITIQPMQAHCGNLPASNLNQLSFKKQLKALLAHLLETVQEPSADWTENWHSWLRFPGQMTVGTKRCHVVQLLHATGSAGFQSAWQTQDCNANKNIGLHHANDVASSFNGCRRVGT